MLHWEVCGRWKTSTATILHCSIPLLWYADTAENVPWGYFPFFFFQVAVVLLWKKTAIFLESQAITGSQNRVVFLRKLQPPWDHREGKAATLWVRGNLPIEKNKIKHAKECARELEKMWDFNWSLQTWVIVRPNSVIYWVNEYFYKEELELPMTAGIDSGLFYMFSYIFICLLVCNQQFLFFIVFIEAHVLWELSKHKSWQQSAIRDEEENKQLCGSVELGVKPTGLHVMCKVQGWGRAEVLSW